MTTPRKLRPGRVPLLAATVEWHVPDDLTLPAWVDREPFTGEPFIAWLSERLGKYRSAEASDRLSAQAREQNAQAISWLDSAVRELRRGDTARLQYREGHVMPGNSYAHCWHVAFKQGLDFDELVRSKNFPILLSIVRESIENIAKRPAIRQRAGRKPLRARDALLYETTEKLRTYRLHEWRDGAAVPRARLLTVNEAARLADGMLAACGVKSASRELLVGAIKRAARRGRQR